MLSGGEALENYAEHRARSELDALLKHAPRKAHILRKGKTISVSVSEIHVGDKLIIKAGEVVPADAVVIEGTASFDEASLTGESLPQSKQIGDQLLSGSINLDGPITAKATATADDSQYQQIIRLVRAASANQAPFVRLADRYSLPFTVFAYGIASGIWIYTGEAIRFLEVIVVATPCPLLLAAPIAVISGMARASRYGIIVKTGSALERLAEAKTIAFDKTGTLTTGVLAVDDIKTFDNHSQADVLGLAASLEQNSNHVVARAIVAEAVHQKIKVSKAKHVFEVSGRGLRAQLKGREVLVGRLSLLEEHDVQIPAGFKSSTVTQTAAYVAVDGTLAGIIKLSDQLRPETKATLERLRSAGLRNMVMVTGDNQATADSIAAELGIDKVYAETLPVNKLHAIDSIKQRPLIFVGDGVNDAPVLTAADVGIALGARGSTAASESADMVIMLDDIGHVASAHEVARKTFRIARQSILTGIGLSLGLMLIFATGKFTPLAGAIVQEVVDVVVIVNALRAHLITPSKIGK
jgi:heavy metal translocating P-type ATPase